MTRTTKAISDSMLKKCKIQLKKQGTRGENGRRLQAIISAKEHGISKVAQIYNISRETLMRWIRKFKQGNTNCFAVQPGRGRRSKLSKDNKLILKAYIEQEGATLTSKKLKLNIKESFNIDVSNSTAHRLLKELNFSYITARPIHYKKNKDLDIEFKKKSSTGNK